MQQELPVRVIEAAFLLKQSNREFCEYVPKSYHDNGVIKNIHIFAFPNKIAYHSTLNEPTHWLYHGFVLTNQSGARVYCHCLRFCDLLAGVKDVLALCVVSKQCYYATMKQFLVHLLSGQFMSLDRLDSFTSHVTPAKSNAGTSAAPTPHSSPAHRHASDELSTDWRTVLNHVVHVGVCPLNSAIALKVTFTGQFLTKSYFTPIPTVRYEDLSPATAHAPLGLYDSYNNLAITNSPMTNNNSLIDSCGNSTVADIPPSCHVHDFLTRQGTVRRACAISFLFGKPPSHPYAFPTMDFDLALLFSTLSIPNILTVYECVLGEAKIVFSTSRVSVLAHITEAFVALLWPFTWEHVLIPVLPDTMLDFLNAPTPFIMGIVRKNSLPGVLPYLDEDVVFVDLDRDMVSKQEASGYAKLPTEIRDEVIERLHQISNMQNYRYDTAVEMRAMRLGTEALNYTCHEKTIYKRNIQFAFFVMWRRLLAGWDFSELHLGEVTQYCQKRVPKPMREFFQVFCITQSFDQYSLRVKNFVMNRPRPIALLDNSNKEKKDATTEKEGGTPSASAANLNYTPQANTNGHAQSGEFNALPPQDPLLASPYPGTPNGQIVISHNYPKPIAAMHSNNGSLNNSRADLKRSDYGAKNEKAVIESQPKTVYQEYKNTVHAYECVHALLTEGSATEVNVPAVVQLFYRPSECFPMELLARTKVNQMQDWVTIGENSRSEESDHSQLSPDDFFDKPDGDDSPSGAQSGPSSSTDSPLPILGLKSAQSLRVASIASPRGPQGLLSPRIDHIKTGFKARSVVGGTKGWGRGKGGANHSGDQLVLNLDRLGKGLNSLSSTKLNAKSVTHGPNGLELRPVDKRTHNSMPDMRSGQDFSSLGTFITNIDALAGPPPVGSANGPSDLGVFSGREESSVGLQCWHEERIRKHVFEMIESLEIEIQKIQRLGGENNSKSPRSHESSSDVNHNHLADNTPTKLVPKTNANKNTNENHGEKTPDLFHDLGSNTDVDVFQSPAKLQLDRSEKNFDPSTPTPAPFEIGDGVADDASSAVADVYGQFAQAISTLPAQYPANYRIAALLYLVISFNQSTNSYESLLCSLGKLFQYWPKNELVTRSTIFDIFGKMKIETKDNIAIWKNMLSYEVIDYYLQLYLEEKYLDNFRKLQTQINSEINERKERNKVELFADAIVTRRWREQEKKNQLYSFDFSFLLSLAPPPSTSPGVISRKAFYQWAVTHGGFRDVLTADNLFRIMTSQKAMDIRKLVNLVTQLKNRYKYLCKLNGQRAELTSSALKERAMERQAIRNSSTSATNLTTHAPTSHVAVHSTTETMPMHPHSNASSSSSNNHNGEVQHERERLIAAPIPSITIATAVKPTGTPPNEVVYATQEQHTTTSISTISTMPPKGQAPSIAIELQNIIDEQAREQIHHNQQQQAIAATNQRSTSTASQPATTNNSAPESHSGQEKDHSRDHQHHTPPNSQQRLLTVSSAKRRIESSSNRDEDEESSSNASASVSGVGLGRLGGREGMIVLHQTSVRFGKDTGQLFLTTCELIYWPNDRTKALTIIPLSIIQLVEPYNYTILLLPGVSGMKVVTSLTQPGEEDVFYIPTGRSFWCASVKEMVSGYQVTDFVGDRSYLIDSALMILYSVTLRQIVSNDRCYVNLFHDAITKGNAYIQALKPTHGLLNNDPPIQNTNNASHTNLHPTSPTKDRQSVFKQLHTEDPNILAFQLLSNAIQLFFSYTVDNKPGKHALSDKSTSRDASKEPAGEDRKPSQSGRDAKKERDEDARFIGYSGIDLVRLRKSKGFAEFCASTAALKRIDRAEMNQNELAAFLINVYNLMVIHGYMIIGFPLSLLEWKFFARSVCYDIGGTTFNLDLIQTLLRGQKVFESQPLDFGSAFEMNEARLRYMLPSLDARIHFVLCQHNSSSLPIRAVTAHTLDQHLEAAANEYFEREIVIEAGRTTNRVTLSMLLYWFQEDFFDGSHALPLAWLTPEQHKKIEALVTLKHTYEIRYKFDWTPNPKLPL